MLEKVATRREVVFGGRKWVREEFTIVIWSIFERGRGRVVLLASPILIISKGVDEFPELLSRGSDFGDAGWLFWLDYAHNN